MPALHGDPRDKFKKKKKQKEETPPPAPERPSGPLKVIMTEEAQVGYDEAPNNVKGAMDEIMERLASWPEVSGVRPLFGKGYMPGKFRMKTWDWRIEFYVNEREHSITILRIGHRDTFYDEYH